MGGVGAGQEGEGEGAGGILARHMNSTEQPTAVQEWGRRGRDRSLLRYATHTYTHKKNGTQVAFPVKVATKRRLCPPGAGLPRGRGYRGGGGLS